MRFLKSGQTVWKLKNWMQESGEWQKKIQYFLENVKKEEEMQHLTQLQLLQAQINPHFLYNTLDTIIWLIEGGKFQVDDAVDMISSLSVFFRTSLSKGKDVIPLSEEKRHTISFTWKSRSPDIGIFWDLRFIYRRNSME